MKTPLDALLFGIGCGLLTFLPDEYVYIWILSSIPFYVYLYCCYQNYLLFYRKFDTYFFRLFHQRGLQPLFFVKLNSYLCSYL